MIATITFMPSVDISRSKNIHVNSCFDQHSWVSYERSHVQTYRCDLIYSDAKEKINSLSTINERVKSNANNIVDCLPENFLIVADIDENPNKTVSIENESVLNGDEYYIHIEIGIDLYAWQYRINSKRIASEDNIDVFEKEVEQLGSISRFLSNSIKDFPIR